MTPADKNEPNPRRPTSQSVGLDHTSDGHDATRATDGSSCEPDVELATGAEPVPGYRLVRLLGRGGFGEVWRAEAPGGFPVAVKFVRLAGHLGEAELRSMPVLRRLRHPNVLSTFGSWQVGGRLVIAMELADRTLSERLKEVRTRGENGIPIAELLNYMRGAARGLDYLNRPRPSADSEPPQSVQHRDVKPQNLLLLADHVKVGDFGLARVLEGTVGRHSGGFTPAYAAPEFFAGEATRQSDQYSLAVTYCELRGGRLPFTGAIGEMMLGHLERPPDLGMLPPIERPAVARALSKRSADRWPTCEAFVDAVAAAMNGSLARSGQTTKAYHPTQRRRWPVLVSGFAVALAAAGVSVYLSTRPPQSVEYAMVAIPTTSATLPTQAPQNEPNHPMPMEADRSVPMDRERPNPPSTKDGAKQEQPGERLRFDKHAGVVRGVAWVPKSDLVVSCGDAGEVWVWNSRTGGEAKRLAGHQGTVHAVAVSADGKRILSCGDDRTVRLWDLERHDLIHTMRKEKFAEADDEFEMYGVAFDDGGQAVSAGNGDRIVRWNLSTGKEAERIATKFAEVLSFAQSPGGKLLLLGGAGGKVIVRKPTDRAAEVEYAGLADDVLAVAWFPDGERFVAGGGGIGKGEGKKDYGVCVWAVGKKEPLKLDGHKSRVTGLSVSPDGRRVLTGDQSGRLRLWDAVNGKELPPIDGECKDPSAVNGVAFSSDGSEAVTAHKDGTVRVWRLSK